MEAGRKGKAGRVKIVFSTDEFFVQLITLIGIFFSNKSDDEVMFYYNARNFLLNKNRIKEFCLLKKKKFILIFLTNISILKDLFWNCLKIQRLKIL